jgi:hypothetical protein
MNTFHWIFGVKKDTERETPSASIHLQPNSETEAQTTPARDEQNFSSLDSNGSANPSQFQLDADNMLMIKEVLTSDGVSWDKKLSELQLWYFWEYGYVIPLPCEVDAQYRRDASMQRRRLFQEGEIKRRGGHIASLGREIEQLEFSYWQLRSGHAHQLRRRRKWNPLLLLKTLPLPLSSK